MPTTKKNQDFQIGGVHHLALVCRDMERTVDFYTNVLGMPLTKTLDLPGGAQHFFFDCGGGDQIAFFWFPVAPERAPGIASPRAAFGVGDATPADLLSAHGSMNHVAFKAPAEKLAEYKAKLEARGVAVSAVTHHDDSPETMSATKNESTFISSIYFLDPDGIMLEFAAWARPLTDRDVLVAPRSAAAPPAGAPSPVHGGVTTH